MTLAEVCTLLGAILVLNRMPPWKKDNKKVSYRRLINESLFQRSIKHQINNFTVCIVSNSK